LKSDCLPVLTMALNYDRWKSLESDDSDDETPQKSTNLTRIQPSALSVAIARKAEADNILDAVNNRRTIDENASSAFARARSLYEGALIAVRDVVGSDEEVSELRKSCHLNITAAALQERKWTVALTHCESALEIDPSNLRALEVCL
jgi:hypothetical protein